MKNQKLRLPLIIFSVAVLVIVVFSAISSIAFKPTVTEAEFPFSITYEVDGETVTISDVYKVRYDGNGGYADTKSRSYVAEMGDTGEDIGIYTLKRDETGRVELWTHFYADYLMGDTEYDYFEDEAFEPRIYYYDLQEQEYHDEETLLAHGVKLVSFEYPTPIENSLVFSHFSYLSGTVAIPSLLIALLALIVTMIVVKKEQDLKYKAIDVITIILNFILCFTFLPFVTVLAVFIDIEGGGPEFYYQATHFLPAISLLCTTASVALRRKGYGVKSLIAQLIAPVFFATYMGIYAAFSLL